MAPRLTVEQRRLARRLIPPPLPRPDKPHHTELDEDRLAVLLEWHESFPVSIYERHRNARIQARQGNHNPFVDNLAFAAKIALPQVSAERTPYVHPSLAVGHWE